MAKVRKITDRERVMLKGKFDYYELRGILPVIRSWPKRKKLPYTALQAEARAVFAIANKALKRIKGNILEAWRIGSVGKKRTWTDDFRGIIMSYWKKNRCIAPIALDYSIKETELEFWVEWTGLRIYIDKTIPEVIREETTLLIVKEDILKMPKPIYFTFHDEAGDRLVAPYILFEVEVG